MAGFMYFILTSLLSVSLTKQIIGLVRDLRTAKERRKAFELLQNALGGADDEVAE